MNTTPPTLAGLFFCLASAEGAGLLFLPGGNAALYRRLQRLLFCPYNYTAHAGAHHSAATPPAYTRYQRHAGRCTGRHSRPLIIKYIRVQQISDHASPAGSAPTVYGSLASATPAHLLRGQRLHLSTWQGPAVSSQPGHGSILAPSHPAEQSSSRGTADGAEPLEATAASLFGLSPDS